jgi:hypothetical protein
MKAAANKDSFNCAKISGIGAIMLKNEYKITSPSNKPSGEIFEEMVNKYFVPIKEQIENKQPILIAQKNI